MFATKLRDRGSHHATSFLPLSSTQSHLYIYMNICAQAHADSSSGNNNQLEYPGKGWLHHVNDLIQISFS